MINIDILRESERSIAKIMGSIVDAKGNALLAVAKNLVINGGQGIRINQRMQPTLLTNIGVPHSMLCAELLTQWRPPGF